MQKLQSFYTVSFLASRTKATIHDTLEIYQVTLFVLGHFFFKAFFHFFHTLPGKTKKS
jgi:hypothetical protein